MWTIKGVHFWGGGGWLVTILWGRISSPKIYAANADVVLYNYLMKLQTS